MDQPVTRRELNETLTVFKQELTDELTAVMRGIETNMLTAFHSYAQSNAVRLNAMDVTDIELRKRMDLLERRVLALETQHPPAA